jgi:hypothetical protein
MHSDIYSFSLREKADAKGKRQTPRGKGRRQGEKDAKGKRHTPRGKADAKGARQTPRERGRN